MMVDQAELVPVAVIYGGIGLDFGPTSYETR